MPKKKAKAAPKRKRHRKSGDGEDDADAPEIDEGYEAGGGLLAFPGGESDEDDDNDEDGAKVCAPAPAVPEFDAGA